MVLKMRFRWDLLLKPLKIIGVSSNQWKRYDTGATVGMKLFDSGG